MKSLFRNILFGNIEITEYSTITIEGQVKENVFLETGDFIINVSEIHWLLCLEPIVFGIWLSRDGHKILPGGKTRCSLYFSGSSNDFRAAKKNAVAIITLDYVDKIEEPGGTLYLLKLAGCRIHHVGLLKTFVLFHKYYKKPKFTFEKYKSLIAAYSYPRRVRIISFMQDDYFNIFPMDLLGEIPASGRYVFGLRHTNVALAKIIAAKKIVVSEVPYIYKDTIYKLGKHHGGSPPSPDSLPFALQKTENFGFLIPEWADGYKEVQILKTKNLGSHMLLWGEIINEKTLKQSPGNLYHIHFLLYYHQKLKRTDYRLV